MGWTKAGLLALAWALPATAFAANWDADSTRLLGDPAFLPLGGQVEGSFSYTYSANTYDFTNDAHFEGFAPIVYSWDHSANGFLPILSYGITDDLTVSAQFGWGNARGEENDLFSRLVFVYPPPPPYGHYGFPGPPTIKIVRTEVYRNFRSIGADNPVFGATWRLADQRAAPVNIDFAVSYAPDIFRARDPEAGGYQTGSVAEGGQRGTLEAAISREMRLMTVRAYATLGYDGRREILEPGGYSTLRSDPRPDFTVGVQTQTRIMPWLALNLGVAAEKIGQIDEQISSGGFDTTQTEKLGGTVSPYAGFTVPLPGGRMTGEFQYQHDIIGDEKVVEPGLTSKYSNNETNLFTARLRFLLF